MPSSVRNVLMLLIVTALAGSVTAVPKESREVVSAGTSGGGAAEELTEGGTGEAGTADGTAADAGAAAGAAAGGAGGFVDATGKKLECAAGKNGGATDKGVTANSINLASTIVTSGPGATFLGLSRYGMEAVVAKVNAAGGICGRLLKLKLDNDNWEAGRGHGYIKNYLNDSYFALPVVPSSEGLSAASADIEKAGMPVIGSDGMRIDQYENPWMWPVATATVSQVRIMAKYAYDQGARGFGIVYDTRYKFGVEGKDAYEKFVKTLPGATLVHAEGIEPGQPGYGPQIRNLDSGCGTKCDAVVMLVDPGTAEVWIAGDDRYLARAKFRMGASPLFNSRFGQNCKERCHEMLVFTGYTPALEANVNLPGVRQYIDDVRAINSNIDTSNQFLEGSYLGMTVFVEALKRVGPNLTRKRLQEVMNSMTYQTDLAGTLSWGPTKRFSNTKAQAWKILASSSFEGFRDARSGWLEDPQR